MIERLFFRPALLIAVLYLAAPACAQRIAEIDALLQGEVDAEHVAGAVVQVMQRGEILHRGAYGFAQRYDFGLIPLDPPDPMSPSHLFDLASLTKVLGTTFAIMLLVDDGVVDLDAPVRRYLPDFDGGEKDLVTVRHLLTHTGGLAQWEPLYYHASTKSQTYGYIANAPREFEVGERRRYSDLGFMLLGYLVEHVSERPLDVFLRERLYGPLGLDRTTFVPLEAGFEPAEIAATSHGNPFERRMVYDDAFGYVCDEDPESWDGWRQYTLRGEVNDGNAHHANEGVAGHAGLFSTVEDIQVLLDLLTNGGRHDERRIIDEATIQAFLTPDAFGNGLGWAMDPAVIQTHRAPEGTFGHTGFTGTNVVVIPVRDLTIILLTIRQNVGPGEDGYYYDLNPTRQELVDIVLQAVTK